jgi:hypothetical protein
MFSDIVVADYPSRAIMYKRNVNEVLSITTYTFSNVITLVVMIITAKGIIVSLILLRI